MGLAGLLKAGWRNLVTSSRMDRMGLLAMGRTAWTTCSRFARVAIAGRRHGKPDGLGGEMSPGGRGVEILPGAALRGAPAAALSRTRNSMKGGPAMRGRKLIKAVMAESIYLLEEPILSLIGGNFVNLYWRNLCKSLIGGISHSLNFPSSKPK